MKPKVLLWGGLSVLTILGAIYFGRSLPQSSPTVIKRSAAVPAKTIGTPQKKFTEPRGFLPAHQAVPPECERALNDLRALDLSQGVPSDLRVKEFESACSSIPKTLDRGARRFLKACEKDGASNPTDGCFASLVAFRASLTDWLTRETPLSEIRDTKVLTDKLVHEFNQDPKKATAVADRLAQLDPSSLPAAKASFLGHFLKARTEGGAEWDEVEKDLERLRALTPSDDKEMIQTQAVVEAVRENNLDNALARADDLDRDHPEWGIGPYQKAWVENRRGHRELALKWLEEACRREPKEPRFQRTLDRLRYSHNISDQQPFEMLVNVNIDEYE